MSPFCFSSTEIFRNFQKENLKKDNLKHSYLYTTHIGAIKKKQLTAIRVVHNTRFYIEKILTLL